MTFSLPRSLFKDFGLCASLCLLALTGCTDSFTGNDEPALRADKPIERLSHDKLRHAHMIEQATMHFAGKGGDSTAVGFILAYDPLSFDTLTAFAPYGQDVLIVNHYHEAFDGLSVSVDELAVSAFLADMTLQPGVLWVEPDIAVEPVPTVYTTTAALEHYKTLEHYAVLERHKVLERHQEGDMLLGGLANEIDPALFASFDRTPSTNWQAPDIFFDYTPDDISTMLETGQVMPWGIERIGAPASSQAAGDGTGTVEVDIYILDTGVSNTAEINLASATTHLANAPTHDDDGHGTHVAGIAAAADDGDGIVGVAPGARVHSVRVFKDKGTTTLANIVEAVEDLIAIKEANPSQPMVANLSVGADIGSTNNNALDDAVQAAVDAGIVMVVAAGNDGANADEYSPAHVAEAITVGAIDVYDRFAGFSNYGSLIDILAPGVDVLSTSSDAQGATMPMLISGTSQAAPHVAGAAALYLSQNPTASPAEVKQALISAAQDTAWDVPAGTTTKTLWVGGL